MIYATKYLSVSGAPAKPAAREHLEKVEIPTVFTKGQNSTNARQWRNLRHEYEQKTRAIVGRPKVIQIVF